MDWVEARAQQLAEIDMLQAMFPDMVQVDSEALSILERNVEKIFSRPTENCVTSSDRSLETTHGNQ